jgi:hypothetical protein
MTYRSAVIAFLPLFLLAEPNPARNSDLSGFDRKSEHIEHNGRLAHPDPSPTYLTEREINAFLASGEAALPVGVRSVHLVGEAGKISGTSRVDFDSLRAGLNSSNPLLSIFSGVHDVVVVAHGNGSRGGASVHVDSVSLDGVEIPRFVLQLFVEHYLKPRFSGIGIDSQFRMPDRIETADVEFHTLRVIQR